MFSFFKNRRRRRLREQTFPKEWRAIIRRNVAYYTLLPDEDKRELEKLIAIFLDEKSFEGARGQKITDEVRLTIAAQACILLLHRDTEVYPALRSIIVYPAAFVARTEDRDGWIHSEGMQTRIGESWSRGSLVLSWNDAMHGAADVADGVNVVFHEFAHQLDDEWIFGSGVPDLGSRELHEQWHRVMTREYRQLIDDLNWGRWNIIDPYGATNPAEFFAVTTEIFFEEPILLRGEHPELYDLFRSYYRQDPAALFGEPSEPIDTEDTERNTGESGAEP